MKHEHEDASIGKLLLGKWATDASDQVVRDEYGDAKLEFGSDGLLTYSVEEDDRIQHIFLTYRVEDGYITTNQPSHPRPERTKFLLTQDGRLHLWFAGQESVFRKLE